MKITLKPETALEILNRIRKANDSVQNTKDYNKYHMQMDYKSNSGKWKHCAWAIPCYNIDNVVVSIKTWKEKTYLIVSRNTGYIGIDRYTLTDSVKKLISDLI